MQVVGASVDSAKANAKFADKFGLSFPLVSDPDREVTAAFGVSQKLIGTAKRTTFLVDADGTVRKVWEKVKARGHAAEVLAACKELWG